MNLDEKIEVVAIHKKTKKVSKEQRTVKEWHAMKKNPSYHYFAAEIGWERFTNAEKMKQKKGAHKKERPKTKNKHEKINRSLKFLSTY